MARKRPRKNKPITTVLQAFRATYMEDMDAFDSMVLSLCSGEAVGVLYGKPVKFTFFPVSHIGAIRAGRNFRLQEGFITSNV